MKEILPIDYRTRMYASYRTGQGRPVGVDDRISSEPYIRLVIQKHFPRSRSARILDLGCGSGSFVSFLHRAGYQNASGVDASPEQVQAAHALRIKQIRQGDLFETLLHTMDSSLDVVITFDVIEHLTKSELLWLGDEVYRVLSTGGIWMIHAPNADSPFGSSIRYRDWTHEQAFTLESMTQVLTAVGFGRVEYYEDQPVPHGVKSSARWALWQVIRLMLQIYCIIETGSTRRRVFSQNALTIATKKYIASNGGHSR